jgi:flavin reductase (DIM6/NTAB) family NADH-FMN oxidoreductase RutF/DNA-binding IclR family transcriptional regulator
MSNQAVSASTQAVQAAQPEMTEFSSVDFRSCLGEFITGVTVITTVGLDGTRYGLTANSFSSVSLDPPLILWSLRLNATNFPIYSTAETFAVNILAEDQVDVSNRFAKSGPNKFDGVAFTDGTGGVPLLDGCVAQLECRREVSYPGGDHVVFIGRVLRIRNTGRKPLALRSGKYMIVHPHEPVSVQDGIDQENIAALNAVHAARPVIEELGRETDRTVGLSVWGNLGPTMIWWRESSRPLQTRVRCGLVVSLLGSSTGAVFAAYAPREVTGALIEAELAGQEAGQGQRFRTRADVEVYLDEVRARGLGAVIDVVSPGINERGHSAFSAPVFDAQGAIVLALAMIGDAEEFNADDPAIDMLRQAAAGLSARLGYRPEYLRHG